MNIDLGPPYTLTPNVSSTVKLVACKPVWACMGLVCTERPACDVNWRTDVLAEKLLQFCSTDSLSRSSRRNFCYLFLFYRASVTSDYIQRLLVFFMTMVIDWYLSWCNFFSQFCCDLMKKRGWSEKNRVSMFITLFLSDIFLNI